MHFVHFARSVLLVSRYRVDWRVPTLGRTFPSVVTAFGDVRVARSRQRSGRIHPGILRMACPPFVFGTSDTWYDTMPTMVEVVRCARVSGIDNLDANVGALIRIPRVGTVRATGVACKDESWSFQKSISQLPCYVFTKDMFMFSYSYQVLSTPEYLLSPACDSSTRLTLPYSFYFQYL